MEKAREKTRNDPRFRFFHTDISSGLPFGDDIFDVVYSSNALECIQDREALISEVHRVLLPCGQVVFSHADWDTQVINGTDKPLIRRVVAAFSDWTQGWMAVSDGWTGRRMAGLFRRHGGFCGEVVPFVLINTEYAPGLYSHGRIMDVSIMAEKGVISTEDFKAFQEDLNKTLSEKAFFIALPCTCSMEQKPGTWIIHNDDLLLKPRCRENRCGQAYPFGAVPGDIPSVLLGIELIIPPGLLT